MVSHDFVIIIPYRNCEEFIKECLASVESQSYKNFAVITIDDNSDDNSYAESFKIPTKNKLSIKQDKRRFSLYNTLYALNKIEWFNSETIVCIVDGDDTLEHDYVLDIINNYYNQHPETLMTYGNMVCDNQSSFQSMCTEYTREEFANLRLHSFRCSHLRTFKYKVWEELLKQDEGMEFARDLDGNWLPSAGDVALQHALMEIAGFDKVKFIKTILYRYRLHSQNEFMVNQDEQIRCMQVANQFRPFKQIF